MIEHEEAALRAARCRKPLGDRPQRARSEAFELDPDGCYQQIAKVAGDDVFTVERPFAVTVIPNELLGGLAA
jgi:hypothetical protein